jgi:hypothetical protein
MELRREHAKAAHALEIASVPRGDAETVSQRGRCDPEVVGGNRRTATAELGPSLRMHAGDSLCDRNRLQPSDHVLDECLTPGAGGTSRPMHPVQELTDGDHADRTILVANQHLERRGAPFALPLDQEPCIDQDGQGLSGIRPASRRRRRRSSANASSTGGAEARSSRNRAAGRSLGLGGAINATGAPARVTSISSPAATRFSTSEKLRATSVAVNRVTADSLSDKSDLHEPGFSMISMRYWSNCFTTSS